MWLSWLWVRLLLSTQDCTPVMCLLTDNSNSWSQPHCSMWVAWAKLSPFDCLLQFLILMFTLDHPMDSPHNLYWVPVLDWTALLHSILSSASSPSSPSSTSGPLMVWQEAVDRNWYYPTWVQLMLQPTPAKWQSLQLTQEIWSDKSVISHHMAS